MTARQDQPRHHHSTIEYRPDVDGLRAIAVLAVVGYHAFPGWVRGGFAGVDVFFVISGFLISSIIFTDLAAGSFRLSGFYARRIRRIFPALLLVMLASYVLGWVVLFTDEYKQLGKHVAAGAGFVVNLVLWGEAGYFDSVAETKPLLHLWSLGVEEQFYLLWPVLAMIFWRYRSRKALIIFCGIALVSFAFNAGGLKTQPVLTYYSLHTRLWELMCGAGLAWFRFRQHHSPGILKIGDSHADLWSLAGLLLLVCSLLMIDRQHGYPGYWALLPVMGTVLLIATGTSAVANRWLLASKPMVLIGLISYPLYLWHWPLLVFLRVIEGTGPSKLMRTAAIVLALIMAAGTHWFVERRFRYGPKGSIKVILLVASMVVIGSIGWITYQGDGFGFRSVNSASDFDGETGGLAYYVATEKLYHPCPQWLALEAPTWDRFVRCQQSMDAPLIDVAIVGDSHAEHLFPGIADALPGKNVGYYIRNSLPFTAYADFDRIYQFIRSQQSIKQVVLAASWEERKDQVPTGSTLTDELAKIVDPLIASGKEVYIMGDVPRFPFNSAYCQRRRWLAAVVPDCEIPAAAAREIDGKYLGIFRLVAQSRPQVQVLPIGNYLCDDEVCKMIAQRRLRYRDDNHLTVDGSHFVIKRLLQDHPGLFK